MNPRSRLPSLTDWVETEAYTARGLPRYKISLHHKGLGKYRVVQDASQTDAREKARAQVHAWDATWKRQQALQEKKGSVENKLHEAALKTEQAQSTLKAVEEILLTSLALTHAIDWKQLKEKFVEVKPSKPITRKPPCKPVLKKPLRPILRNPPPEPKKAQTEKGFLDFMIPGRYDRRQAAAYVKFRTNHKRWTQQLQELKRENERKLVVWEERSKKIQEEFPEKLNSWADKSATITKKNEELQKQYKKECKARQERKRAFNVTISRQQQAYTKGTAEGVVNYCNMVLENSTYPSYIPKKFEIDYNSETKILIVDYLLPLPQQPPRLTELKYIEKRDAFVEKELPQTAQKRLYDSLLYQICLRTIHEIYDADTSRVVDALVFNGWVKSINAGTGKEVTACILSVQAGREEFLNLNLAKVDPKACFKALKGVGSSKLHGLAPVAPMMRIERKDSRFIPSHDVVEGIDEATNLAAMDWEDFEHLIREVFEAEFAGRGGEVKVTQASRDRGVDAVAFDTDPISGGKIVIQAKRYTNTVGVAAVRDLYGTVMNEGANKGILVTTSDYGPDAYEFAKGKPLTLLSGSNLLHLLSKHGHKAKIDLKEAKKILAEEDSE